MSKSEKLLIKIEEANKNTSEYKALFEKYRTQYIENTTKSELKEYQKQGADIRVKIEELDKNKPMFLEKGLVRKA